MLKDVTATWLSISGQMTNGTEYRILEDSSPNISNMINKTTQSPHMDMACYEFQGAENLLVSHRVNMFARIVFVLVGLVGNMLSVIVFSSKEMRPVSSNVYLLVLAISDTVFLLVVFAAKVLNSMHCLYFKESSINIYHQSHILCIMLQYLLDLFSDYSTCLILVFTIERFIAVYKPLKFKELCTVRRARICCVGAFVVIATLIAPHHFLFMGVVSGYNACTVLPGNEDVFTIIYMLEVVALRVVPVFVIAILNVYIIRKVTTVARRKKQRKASNGKSNGTKRDSKRVRREDKSMQLTIMLILVSTSYIILYIPVIIHFVLLKLSRDKLLTSITVDSLTITGNYTKTLYIAGFAINFFLYTMSGKVFREQLDVLLCDPHGRHDHKGHGNSTYVSAV